MTRAYVTVQRAQVSVSLGVLTSNALRLTDFDAKGDLLVGTAADTMANLAVGADGYVLTADSAAATGIKWAAPAGAVTSVNGEVGVVVLDAADVGAEATGTVATHAALTSGVHGITTFAATLLDDTTQGGMRTTLGLGNAAVRDVGTTNGTVAAGDDSRITGAIPYSIYTTKGGFVSGSGAGTAHEITLATNGETIIADSTQTGGFLFRNLKYAVHDAVGAPGKGEIYVSDAVETRTLDAGTDGYVLTADAASAYGVKWAAASVGGSGIAETLIDAKGDLIVGSAADTAARLAGGSNGQVLQYDTTATNYVAWKTPVGGFSLGASGGPHGPAGARTTASTSYDRVAGVVRVTAPLIVISAITYEVQPGTYGLYIDGVDTGYTETNGGGTFADVTFTHAFTLFSGDHFLEFRRTSGTSSMRDADDSGAVGQIVPYASGGFVLFNTTYYGSTYTDSGYTPCIRITCQVGSWSGVGAVGTDRTLTTTAPLTIGGGASADLSADRTLAISNASTTAVGVVERGTDGETSADVVVMGNDYRLKPSLWVALNSTVNVTFTNAPAAATEVFSSTGAYRAQCNLEGYKYVRFYVRISTTAPVSGSRCALQYSIDGGSNFRNMDVESGSSASPDTGAVVTASPWTTVATFNSGKVAIAAAARADNVWLRCLTDGGDGVVDWIGQKIEAVFTVA